MKNLDILIVGYGGSGQSYIMDMLRRKYKINDLCDVDKLKHLSSPTLDVLNDYRVDRCLFIYGDPLDAICSHFRRRWQYVALNKFGNYYQLSAQDVITLPTFLEKVSCQKKELFSIEHQFTNWIQSDKPFPTLFLDSQRLFKNDPNLLLELNQFLGETLSFNLVDRHDYQEIKKQFPQVVEMYQQLYDKFKRLAAEHNQKSMHDFSKL